MLKQALSQWQCRIMPFDEGAWGCFWSLKWYRHQYYYLPPRGLMWRDVSSIPINQCDDYFSVVVCLSCARNLIVSSPPRLLLCATLLFDSDFYYRQQDLFMSCIAVGTIWLTPMLCSILLTISTRHDCRQLRKPDYPGPHATTSGHQDFRFKVFQKVTCRLLIWYDKVTFC